MNHYLQTINYSSVNEDSQSEIKALKLTERDSVLCITGSGARVLDLLTQNPKKILALCKSMSKFSFGIKNYCYNKFRL